LLAGILVAIHQWHASTNFGKLLEKQLLLLKQTIIVGCMPSLEVRSR
jgi:hypothetical protein